MGKYLFIFRLSLLQALKRKNALFGLSLFLLTCLIIFAHIWKLAAAQLNASHLDPNQLLWYIALNEWVLISIPDIQVDMERDLKSGKLTYLLPRPISYLGATFAEALGPLIANLLTLGLVAFAFAWLRTGFFPPYIPLFILFALFSSLLCLLFQMVIGLSAFWLREVTPIQWIWEKFLFAFGGLILPLSVYPLWLQKIALFTPFPAILGQRSAQVLDFTPFNLLSSLTLWTFLSLLLLTLLYKRGLKILNHEGG
jgi:ABC-2 type transport system permease protein